MTEKEKFEIIKEIAECNKDSCKDCKIICSYYSAITSFCEKVLPEGSVVLTKEEYEELNITGKYFNEALNKTRKETATEILTEIWSKGVKSVTSTDNSKCFLEITYEKLKEIAKQYGVVE